MISISRFNKLSFGVNRNPSAKSFVLSSFSNMTEGKIPLTLILILIFYIISEIKNSILEGNKQVYHDGHLIGAICGILFGFFFLYYPSITIIS